MEQPQHQNYHEQQSHSEELAETARWETQNNQQIEHGPIDQSDRYLNQQKYAIIKQPPQKQQNPFSKNQKYNKNKDYLSQKHSEHSIEVQDENKRNQLHKLATDKTTRNHTEYQNQFIEKELNQDNSVQKSIQGEQKSQNKSFVLEDCYMNNDSNIIGFQLKECETCGRKFMINRLQKHSKICSKVKNKRKVFVSKQKRVDGLSPNPKTPPPDIKNILRSTPDNTIKNNLSPLPDKLLSSIPEQSRSTAATDKRSHWKIDHENFIKSIRSVRVNPSDPHSKSYHVPLQNPDYVFCKHCERRFAPNVAEVHIPKCQHIYHRPKPPSQRKASFLRALNSLQKEDFHKISGQSSSSIRGIKLKKLQPICSAPKQAQPCTIQVSHLSKPKSSILEHPQTFTGLLKNYQNVEMRSSNYSNIQCPHCNRKFASKASQRHIPICQQIYKHKIHGLKQVKEVGKRGNSSNKLQLNPPDCCKNCGFKFSIGHKYCSNCGKKRKQ